MVPRDKLTSWSRRLLALLVIYCCLVQGQRYSAQDQQLTAIPDDIPLEATSVSLKNNLIEIVSDTAFAGYRQLATLDLSNNQITHVSDAAFKGTVLSYLRLDYNRLTVLPNLNYIGLTLTHLYASYNQIQAIPSEAFQRVVELKYLYVDHNEISRIDPDVFVTTAPSLTTLELGHNRLQELSPRIFVNMGKISKITLQNNRLQSFPDFSQLPYNNSMSSLYLNTNEFGNLPDDALTKLKHLVTLAMSFNQLTQWPNFENQASTLRSLYLSGNRISELPPDAFDGMSLSLLNLERNGLKEIPEVLSLRSTLQTLYVSGNDFGAIPSETMLRFLQTMVNLTTLNVVSVGLTTFPDIRLVGREFRILKLLNTRTMVCDCGIKWLKEPSALSLVKSGMDVKNTSRVCASPESLRGVQWGSITPEKICPGG